MFFEWDERKNKINKTKHGISFELASYVFEDPKLLTWEDITFDHYFEERWISLGSIENLLILTVVHTIRSNQHGEEISRIISARKATKKEKEIYFKNFRTG